FTSRNSALLVSSMMVISMASSRLMVILPLSFMGSPPQFETTRAAETHFARRVVQTIQLRMPPAREPHFAVHPIHPRFLVSIPRSAWPAAVPPQVRRCAGRWRASDGRIQPVSCRLLNPKPLRIVQHHNRIDQPAAFTAAPLGLAFRVAVYGSAQTVLGVADDLHQHVCVFRVAVVDDKVARLPLGSVWFVVHSCCSSLPTVI